MESKDARKSGINAHAHRQFDEEPHHIGLVVLGCRVERELQVLIS